MQQFRGNGIVDGVATGTVFFCGKDAVARVGIEDPEAELKLYQQAKASAKEELSALYEKALTESGKESAAIFEVQQLLIEDGGYNASVASIIWNERVCAGYAVQKSGEKYAAVLEAMDDPLFAQRAADVKDVTGRLLRILNGGRKTEEAGENVILAAEELTPSDVFLFERSRMRGLVTAQGTAESHAAILARTMDIPMISGIEVNSSWNGKTAAVDGGSGSFILEPDDEVLKELKEDQRRQAERKTALLKLKGKPSVSRDGKQLRICVNIGSTLDLPAVRENDAEGIGLFRSEFLYMEQQTAPSEEIQYKAYREAAEKADGRSVVIRTFDLGADKQAGFEQAEAEKNPALGYRGIRISLREPEAFHTQLRAILRAALCGDVSILFPMIISADEFRQCKKHVEEAKEELRKNGVPYKEDVKLGVMIETPAAAVISEMLAKEADFFSIGSNDLAQYTLALDRGDPKLEDLRDPHHPAVLKLIRLSIENAHKHGIPVSVCGELAADMTLTQTFLDYGVDSLSVSPAMILPLREAVRNCM